MLQVEETWKELEYIVLPHKDTKDVFILGTLEEIQTALDESNINVATILSSRHVGPIKPRVEEWARILDQFSKTLVNIKKKSIIINLIRLFFIRTNGRCVSNSGCI